MKSLMTLILSICLTACSGGSFTGGAERTSSNGSAEQIASESTFPPANNGTTDTNNPPKNDGLNPDPNKSHMLPPGTAVIPVAIGGASLTCQEIKDASIYCSTNLAASVFVPTVAWYATDLEKQWIATSFEKDASNNYIVKVPESVRKSIAKISIMVMDSNSNSIADMEVSDNARSLLVDGSFESNRIDPARNETAWLSPRDQTAWKAFYYGSPSVSANCEPFVQLSGTSLVSELAAADGNQWAKLSTRCFPTNGYTAEHSNVGIKQRVKVTKHKTYIFSFSYRRAGIVREIPSIKIIVAGKESSFEVKNTAWLTQSNSHLAESDEIDIIFIQTNNDGDEGAHIDNVKLIEH